MVLCPECESDLDIAEDEVDEGDIVSCGESGRDFEVMSRRADEKKAKWELYSDQRGEFAQRVPAGEADYIVWADVKTHKDAPPPEVKVHIENDERQDIGLHLTE